LDKSIAACVVAWESEAYGPGVPRFDNRLKIVSGAWGHNRGAGENKICEATPDHSLPETIRKRNGLGGCHYGSADRPWMEVDT